VHNTEPRPVKLGELPEDAAMIFVSMRWQPDRVGPVNSEVFVANREGKSARQITFTGREYNHAAVSPDHRYVASMVGRHEEKKQIWLYDLEKKTETRIVPEFEWAGVGGMEWSPDGFFYFAGGPKPGGLDVYKIRPDGTGLTQLTETPEIENDVSLAEDGSLVAYSRITRIKNFPKPQIWVMNADGTGQRMVYDGGPELGAHGQFPIGAYDPEFSPDNSKVIFSRSNTKTDNFGWGGHDICVINIDGTGLKVLTAGTSAVQAVPDWTRHGILYTELNEKDQYVGIVFRESEEGTARRLETGLKNFWDGGRHARWIPPLNPNWPEKPSESGKKETKERWPDTAPRHREVLGQVSYLPARFGTGFLADQPGEIVTYPTPDQLLPSHGTIELWVQAHRAKEDGLEWNPLFVAQEKPFQPLRGLIIQLIRHSSALVFVAGTPEQNGVVAAIDWEKGQSHYIAATWGDEGTRLYVDGERVGESPKKPDLRDLPERLSIGGFIWSQAKNPSNTIIDELRISSFAKEAEQIRAAYRSARAPGAERGTLLLDHLESEVR
jgi:Tol biopolymer transport system component